MNDCWLPLTSMTRPRLSGTSELWAKKAIFCGTPSSVISISSWVRFVTRLPRSSRTLKPTLTRLTSTRIGACAASREANKHTAGGSFIPADYVRRLRELRKFGQIDVAAGDDRNHLPCPGATRDSRRDGACRGALGDDAVALGGEFHRSEERRVGKECRSRWSPY